jgi:hypothetical protein
MEKFTGVYAAKQGLREERDAKGVVTLTVSQLPGA